MVRRPLIGISTQTLETLEGPPALMKTSMVMNQRYHLATAAAGGVPLLVPLIPDDLETLRQLYDRLDGVLLPGGVDIDPVFYGQPPHEKLGELDSARDRTEIQLVRWALEDAKPLLCICRGLQLLNVACGGTLFQDVADMIPGALRHDCSPEFGFPREHIAHNVNVASGTRLRAIAGADQLAVNSLHHQSINALGDGLRVSALAPDGVVEGVEGLGDSFLVGVQWHPEAFVTPDAATRAIFHSFVESAAEVGAASGR